MTDVLCQCGCGLRTEPCKVNNRRLGYVKGMPNRFVFGHGGFKDHNPEGIRNQCQCGCGMDAGVYKRTNRATGQVKGMPRRFIPGHQSRYYLTLRWKDKIKPGSGRGRAEKLFNLGQCKTCGGVGRVRHHKDKNPLNNDPENVQILCHKCHNGIHENWRYRWRPEEMRNENITN